MGELMTIGAFAKRTGLSVSAVRFYGSQQLLVPAGVDASSGYRLYAEAQVDDGILIRDLRRLELPLSDIAAALELPETERRKLVERHLHRLQEILMRAHDLARTMGVIDSAQETSMTASLQTSDLARALDQVVPASGTDPERPDLMGVLIEAKDASIRLVATDSYRLAVRDLVPSHLDGDFRVIVPAATISQWRAALGGVGEITLALDGDQLEVSGHGGNLSARTLPITFPDYEQFLVPAEDTTIVRIDRDSLIAALEGIDPDATITITTSATLLRVAHDRGSVEVDAIGEGPEQHLGMNARFLSEAMLHSVAAEVIVEIEDPLSPVLFRSADDGTFTVRVMPVKLD